MSSNQRCALVFVTVTANQNRPTVKWAWFYGELLLGACAIAGRTWAESLFAIWGWQPQQARHDEASRNTGLGRSLFSWGETCRVNFFGVYFEAFSITLSMLLYPRSEMITGPISLDAMAASLRKSPTGLGNHKRRVLTLEAHIYTVTRFTFLCLLTDSSRQQVVSCWLICGVEFLLMSGQFD